MQVHVLASGSTGNASYIVIGEKRLLVDAGISCRRITTGLHKLGIDPSQLDGILISHEHHDHIRGLEVLCRRYHLPVYTRTDTWARITARAELPADCHRPLGERLDLGPVSIDCVPISHDAVDPIGFVFRHADTQIASITDTGCISHAMLSALAGSDIMILESNHDVTMLKEGPYPAHLKKRIASNHGHLSNLECGRLLALVEKHPRRIPQVFLAHLSQKNNEPALASTTVEQELRKIGRIPGQDIQLHLTHAELCCSLELEP